MLSTVNHEASHYAIFSSLVLLPPCPLSSSPPILKYPQPVFPLSVRDQVSHTHTHIYKTMGKIVVLCILILIFLENEQEDKRLWTEWLNGSSRLTDEASTMYLCHLVNTGVRIACYRSQSPNVSYTGIW